MTTSDYQARLESTKRNDACPCGSGRKYKKCHLAEDQTAERAAKAKLEAEAAAVAAAEAAAAEKAEGDEDGEETDGTHKSATKAGGSNQRRQQQSANRPQTPNARPKNLPRRKAV